MFKAQCTAEEAIQALIQGQETGLDFFFHQHYAPLSYFAYRLVEDKLLAEEMASEAFIKLWEHREKFTTPAYLKNWLYNTVRNAAIDHLRKVKRLRVSTDGLQSHEQVEQSVLHRLIATETLQQVVRTLAQLPPKCRQVFRLYYFQGLTHGEIAQALNISPHTVKNQRNKAVRILKEKTGLLMLFLLPCLFL